MIDIIEKTIHLYYHLKRKYSGYFSLDNGVKLRASSHCSFAFSLDKRKKGKPTPFPFFGHKPHRPEHIAKMCDAIAAMNFKNELFLFVIEQKTQHPDDYKKQLANGRHFCNWLFSLYKEHKYYSRDPVYIGLLIWEPRPNSPRKGTTAHQNKNQRKSHPSFDLFFEKRNIKDISLPDLAKSALSHQKKGKASPPEKRISNLPISPKTAQ